MKNFNQFLKESVDVSLKQSEPQTLVALKEFRNFMKMRGWVSEPARRASATMEQNYTKAGHPDTVSLVWWHGADHYGDTKVLINILIMSPKMKFEEYKFLNLLNIDYVRSTPVLPQEDYDGYVKQLKTPSWSAWLKNKGI
jgi:hypothetical protein